MRLDLTKSEIDSVEDVDRNCSKHIAVVNDIYSWEKELRQSEMSDKEGSILCSSVQVMASEASVNIAASKRILWSMCREWELRHLNIIRQEGIVPQLRRYCKGLEYQMSGNELWSKTTKRYSEVTES